MNLPADSEEIAAFSEPSFRYLTLQRTPNGAVYLVSWAYGVSTVLAAAYPDGTHWPDPEREKLARHARRIELGAEKARRVASREQE